MEMGIVSITARATHDPSARCRAPLPRLLALIVAVVVATAACSPFEGSGKDDQIEVSAAFYPLAEAASKIGGNLVEVHNLTPPGVEPHDLELTPDKVAQIQEADVVLFLGHGFAPAVEEAVAEARGVTVDVLDGLPLRAEVAEEAGAAGPDPHVWLDPVLFRRVVARVEKALVHASPGDSATFEANQRSFDRELGRLDEDYRMGLSGCSRDLIVTSHAAFGYLAARYGLIQESIAGFAPDAEPSPARLAELANLVESKGVTRIFTEELVSPRVAQTLAREVGVGTSVLNPLEGLTAEEIQAGDGYVSVMHENLTALMAALGCPDS